MSFELSEKINLGKVVINVHDLWNMLTFYQEKLGLDVLESSDHHALLGIKKDGSELLELRVSNAKPNTEPHTGLYHIAFLLPTRRDLANILFSLITQKNVDIQGASDHGYSEAIYLTDPEGNGIEIYRDKPKEEWTILEDGTIPGVTVPMDGNGVLAEKDEGVHDHMPNGTVIGHIHLMVSDIKESIDFYRNVIGLELKFNAGSSAAFMAAGEYHHHVAMNVWSTDKAVPIKDGDLGIVYYTIEVNDQAEFEEMKSHVRQTIELTDVTEQSFKMFDPNGIGIKVTLA
ncbi:MAG TPA: VOC family protein [Alloiococcus sp.]|nr:VOC family protein [Alloiococcus sp.]